jgi:hypothetical protein
LIEKDISSKSTTQFLDEEGCIWPSSGALSQLSGPINLSLKVNSPQEDKHGKDGDLWYNFVEETNTTSNQLKSSKCFDDILSVLGDETDSSSPSSWIDLKSLISSKSTSSKSTSLFGSSTSSEHFSPFDSLLESFEQKRDREGENKPYFAVIYILLNRRTKRHK